MREPDELRAYSFTIRGLEPERRWHLVVLAKSDETVHEKACEHLIERATELSLGLSEEDASDILEYLESDDRRVSTIHDGCFIFRTCEADYCKGRREPTREENDAASSLTANVGTGRETSMRDYRIQYITEDGTGGTLERIIAETALDALRKEWSGRIPPGIVKLTVEQTKAELTRYTVFIRWPYGGEWHYDACHAVAYSEEQARRLVFDRHEVYEEDSRVTFEVVYVRTNFDEDQSGGRVYAAIQPGRTDQPDLE